MIKPREGLVAHIKELIDEDPETYVGKRMPYILDKIADETQEEKE